MNMINMNIARQCLSLIERNNVGFSKMVSQLYAKGAQENDIAEYVKFIVANFCSSITLMDNMPADSDGQVEYISNMILEYIKDINNYCHEEIVYSDKLSECAGIIHAIEEGTANQRQINQAFNSAYDFVDADDTGTDRVRNTDDFRKKYRRQLS